MLHPLTLDIKANDVLLSQSFRGWDFGAISLEQSLCFDQIHVGSRNCKMGQKSIIEKGILIIIIHVPILSLSNK